MHNKEKTMDNNPEYDKIPLAIMAIDKAARKMNVPKTELYDRLNKQNLVHDRLSKIHS